MSNDAQHGHNHEPNIYDLGLQADLSMWTKAPIERRRIWQVATVTGDATAGDKVALVVGVEGERT